MKLRTPPSALVWLTLLASISPLPAQVRPAPVQPQSGTETEETESEKAPEQVIVEREAMKLIDPEVYQVPMQLVPSRFITVVSPATGVIASLEVKPGDQLSDQSVLFRLDHRIEDLQVKQAEAEVALKKLQLEQAKQGGTDAQAVAAAELKVAEAGLEIANARLEKTVVRTEGASEVFRTHAVQGELVTLYQKVVDIGDPSKMTVEIPVERSAVEQDGSVTVKIEEQEMQARVVAVLPPAEKFEPLRDLFDSLASAQLEIDNRDRNLKAGQAVYVSSIPREIVTEIPNSTIVSQQEGQRKVQVIRKSVVRDLIVKVLAPVGADRSFVSGPFQTGDELILTSSMPLADGTQLSPKVTGQTASGTDPNTGRKTSTGGF